MSELSDYPSSFILHFIRKESAFRHYPGVRCINNNKQFGLVENLNSDLSKVMV